MQLRDTTAAALMRAAQSAPDRLYPKRSGIRIRSLIARCKATPGAWIEPHPREIPAAVCLADRGILQCNEQGQVRTV